MPGGWHAIEVASAKDRRNWEHVEMMMNARARRRECGSADDAPRFACFVGGRSIMVISRPAAGTTIHYKKWSSTWRNLL
jgi:hypothetical protein